MPTVQRQPDAPLTPRRCPMRSCAFRGPVCPVHDVKRPRGFGQYAALVTAPNPARRPR
jgi:hypothetical protein